MMNAEDQIKQNFFEGGYEEWRCSDGRLHRTDGPAVIWSNGTRIWYLNGQRHRTDGPAVIYANGSQQWWVDGQRLSEDEFQSYRFRQWAIDGVLVQKTSVDK